MSGPYVAFGEDDGDLELDAMPVEEKEKLFCVGLLHGLVERGLVEHADGVRMTERGHAAFAILKASGFRPSEEAVRHFAWVVAVPADIQNVAALLLDAMR